MFSLLNSNNFALFLGFVLLAVTIVPLCMLAYDSFKAINLRSKIGVLALSLCVGVFLCLRAHEALLTGLDTSAYRITAKAISTGRALHEIDSSFDIIPQNVRPFLLYSDKKGRMRTRDTSFRLLPTTTDHSIESISVPWFLPSISLEAAFLSKIGVQDKFLIPLISILAMFTTGVILLQKGGWNIAIFALTLLLSTPYPAWFCRGYYSEVAGALATSVATCHILAFPKKKTGIVGFILGLSFAYHRSVAMIAVSIFMILLAAAKSRKDFAKLLISFAIGSAFSAFIVLGIANPYGNTFLGGASEKHWAVGIGIPVALIAIACCVSLLRVEKIRLSFTSPKIQSFINMGFTIVGIAALASPLLTKGLLHNGAMRLYSGFGPVGIIVFGVAFAIFWTKRATIKNNAIISSIILCSLAMIFVTGKETPVGVWSNRRIVPTIIIITPILALSAMNTINKYLSTPKLICLACLAALNYFIHPTAYVGIEDKGSEAFAECIEKKIDSKKDVVLFDYFLHQTTVSPIGGRIVFGVREWAYHKWGDVYTAFMNNWRDKKHLIFSSYIPPLLEDGVRLKSENFVKLKMTSIKSNRFLLAKKTNKEVNISILQTQPVYCSDPITQRRQEKVLDGGPIALRGTWLKPKNGWQWACNGASIIGPVAVQENGESVKFELSCRWIAPSAEKMVQTVRITAPWGAFSDINIQDNDTGVQVELSIPGAPETYLAANPSGTAIYTISSPTPYDPANYNIKNYPTDLIAEFQKISIRVAQ